MIDLNQLSALVSLLLALSLASERLVSIFKGFIPSLNQPNPDPTAEGRRSSYLQIASVVAGIFTAGLAWPFLTNVPAWLSSGEGRVVGVLALGLLASGGSGLWNSVQGYLNLVKDIKKAQAATAAPIAAAAVRRADAQADAAEHAARTAGPIGDAAVRTAAAQAATAEIALRKAQQG
jgi:hypothetical protein